MPKFRFPFTKARVTKIVFAEPALDSDAQDFITRAGITDNTQKDAINTMVLSLKGNSIWTSMEAIYPFVGGSASSHSHNLKSSSYQITWSGTITHNSDGITGVSSAKGDTGYSMASDRASDNAWAMGVYCRSTGSANSAIFANNAFGVWTRFAGLDEFRVADGFATNVVVSNTDGSGFYVLSRTASNALAGYKNGTVGNTGSNSGGFVPSAAIQVPQEGNDQNLALAFIYDAGLTGGQVSTLNTIIEAYQDALGRGVQ